MFFPRSLPRAARLHSVRCISQSANSAAQESARQARRKVLLTQASVGLVAGLGIALYSGWRDSTGNTTSTIQCESPPAESLIVNRGIDQGETMNRNRKIVNHLGDAHDPTRPQEFDDPANPMRIRMSTWVMELQDRIVQGLEELEAAAPPNEHAPEQSAPKFQRDHWLRPQGGEGSSCVIRSGRVFEKGGVNVSVVHGKLPPAAIRQMKADHKSLNISEEDKDKSLPFFAAGISIVLHPWNPHAPTVHMNYRYFEVDKFDTPSSALDTTSGTASVESKSAEPLAWWFGGGSDLTPSYLYPEDAEDFHNSIKRRADAHHTAFYPAWKKWADKYFYIPHRGESRGVGGIFFDDLTTSSEIHSQPGKRITHAAHPSFTEKLTNRLPASISPSSTEPLRDPSINQIFEIVQNMSSGFLESYVPIMKKRMYTPITVEERRWQLLRRGRYVEFNLVYDRGTKFGLHTPGARVESILMSLPDTARWEYMTEMGAPGSGTREEALIEALKNPKEWATI